MNIRIGYELIYDCPQPTPMILTLSVHYSRVSDMIVPDHLIADPPVPLTAYRDSFGNWCSRIVAPQGQVRLSTDALVRDTGLPDPVVPHARQTPVEELPDETLLFLLGSRYCETDRLSETAWHLFGKSPTGWARVQAICDYVHQHIVFGYEHARPTKTAYEVFRRAQGRLPRLRASGHRILSLHEYPRTLLHRLPRRHGYAAALWPDGFRRLVRGLS